MLADLIYAWRQLRNSPAFAVTAVVTLALGIGANTAIFSVVDAVLRHPAGVDHPEQVAVLHTRYAQFTLDMPFNSVPTYATAASLQDQVEAAAIEHPASFNIERDGEAEHIPAARVSSQWFEVYGARPILGRTFTAQEDQPNAGPVVVLSYGIWQRIFGGRSDVVGQTLLLDDKPYQVVGVMRSDFAWPRRSEIWVPIALAPSAFKPDEVFNENYYAVARLRPGISVPQFSAAVATKMWGELRSGGSSKFEGPRGTKVMRRAGPWGKRTQFPATRWRRSTLTHLMAKRLQVIVQDPEYRDIQRAARLRRMSIAEWVRQALVQARRSEPSREVASKLEVIRGAARMDFPTADIDRMLEEIERGYGSGMQP
jgi:hypothetical protein